MPPTQEEDNSSSAERMISPKNSFEDEEELEEEKAVPTPKLGPNGRVNKLFVEQLTQYLREQQRLSTLTAHKILRDAKELFQTLPSLVDIHLGKDDVINICGDLHGQFYDLCKIFELLGPPSARNMYLFNGDFVDRGPWSMETILLLFSYKLLYPDFIFLNRGNHECEEVNRIYGFLNEVLDKYDQKMFDLVQEVFVWLPLSHCINDSVLVMHGGLSGDETVSLGDIRRVKRGIQVPRKGVMCDLLWSDPQENEGITSNPRGYSCLFGPDVTSRFLSENNLLYIIRSHECVQYGYDMCHDDKIVTVFSAPNYCDRHHNRGAVCVLHGDDVSMPEFKKFDAAPHPKVRPMMYANVFMRMGIL